MKRVELSELIGKTIVEIKGSEGDDIIEFLCSDGSGFNMQHDQDCCESVYVEDIVGDLDILLNSPVISFTEDCSAENVDPDKEASAESFTWTFYNIATTNGVVTIRWFGESNGYYSESVDFYKV